MKSSLIVLLVLFLITCTVQAEQEPGRQYTRNVAIVLYPNVQPLDWTGPYEVYNDAGSFGAVNGERAFNVYTVSKNAEVNGQGLQLKPTYTIKNAPKPDIVIFPGGPASHEINDDPEFFAWAKGAATEAEIAQSVCTGAFVLGKAGLLDGLTVTTFYGAIDSLRKEYPKANVQDGRRFVDNGKVVTTAGISAGIDGSLHVVARLLGRRVADQTARYMEYHWTPDSYLTKSYQYLNPSTDEAGRLMQTASMRREEGNIAEATKAYQAVLELQPKNVSAMQGLGDALHAAHQYNEAAQVFVTASKSAEGYEKDRAMYNAACAYALAGKLDEAANYVQAVLAGGHFSRAMIDNEPDLAKLKGHPRLAMK